MAEVVGDIELARTVGRILGERPGAWAAASIASETRICASGADLEADFEIGSLSKGITGLLYADGIARGEVRGDTQLGALLPLDNRGHRRL